MTEYGRWWRPAKALRGCSPSEVQILFSLPAVDVAYQWLSVCIKSKATVVLLIPYFRSRVKIGNLYRAMV